jgi:hypothetical protein
MVPEVQVRTKLEPSKQRAEVPVPGLPRADSTKVLSSVVAPCKVRAPGVVEEPMVLIEEAPLPKVLVVDEPVAKVELPEEVRLVNAPLAAVVAPI